MAAHRNELYRRLKAEKFESAFRYADAVVKQGESGFHPDFVYGGCVALFGLGHIQQARSWAAHYEQLQPGSAKSLYLQAFISLHARKSDEALLTLTRIIQVDPGDTFADRLISKIKRGQDRILDELEEPGALFRFVPLPDLNRHDPELLRPAGVSGRMSRRFLKILTAVLSVFILGTVSGTGIFLYRYFTNPFTGLLDDLPVIPDATTVLPPDAGETEFRYESQADATSDFQRARQLIASGRVNQGRNVLAKIERSNADFLLRDRATLLRQSIPVIEAAWFDDPVSPAQYLNDPFAYRDADILWSGRIEKLSTDEESGIQTFSFYPAGAGFRMQAVYPYQKRGKKPLQKGENQVELFGRLTENPVAAGQPEKISGIDVLSVIP